jgi:hypothetical protein
MGHVENQATVMDLGFFVLLQDSVLELYGRDSTVYATIISFLLASRLWAIALCWGQVGIGRIP